MADRVIIDSETESLMPISLAVPASRTSGTMTDDNVPKTESPASKRSSISSQTPQIIIEPTDNPNESSTDPADIQLDTIHRSKSESNGLTGAGPHDGHHGTDMGLVTHRLQNDQGMQAGSCDPPSIVYDEVVTTPSTPTGERARTHDLVLQEEGLLHISRPVESKSTSITPASSLLAVNKPIQLRESTLTVNYPDEEMGRFNSVRRTTT